MPAILTKDSVRAHVATRLVRRLRRSRNHTSARPPRPHATQRTRVTDDGKLIGRTIVVLPFDL